MYKRQILVDRAQQTNVAGCFAAGDCTGRPYPVSYTHLDVYKRQAPDSWEAPVPDHTFTIYYYNEDLSTDTDMGKVDLWMWNAGLDGRCV